MITNHSASDIQQHTSENIVPSVQFGLASVPRDVIEAMEKIFVAGFDVWLVGGALRDLLMKVRPKDWDLATSAGPEQIMKIFPRVIPVGIRHGTVQVHTKTRDIEVTSFEPSGWEGILKDLGRRDFTINALALSFPDGMLIDPHDGRADIKRKMIRAVGDPPSRFAEDPLRIVRAARLSSIYGFAVDSATFEAMRGEAENLEKISGERIRDELCKILVSRYPIEAFDLLRKSWALGKLLHELVVRDHVDTMPGSSISVYRHSLLCVRNSPKRLRIRLAALFHSAGVPATGARGDKMMKDYSKQSAYTASVRMKKWNMSNRQIEDVSTLIENQLPVDAESWSDVEIRQYLVRFRSELLEDVIALAKAESLAEGRTDLGGIDRLHARMREQLDRISAFKIEDLAVGGQEIMDILGLAPGPEVGKVLRWLFSRVLEHPGLNTHESLIEIVKRDFIKRS
jgi:tRNA nucleotidyltransferase (CCA-adding enzyme)